MKIVSWNANCKFREKYKSISTLDADVYVIQECENPATCKDTEFREFVKNGFWKGELNYKGVMVFTTRPDIKLETLDWGGDDKNFFIPVRINDKFDLVAAWACKPYSVVLYEWVEAVLPHLSEGTVIIGDLNSNFKFDQLYPPKDGKSFEQTLKILQPIGLFDMWHYHHNEQEGKETVPTFYLYRHLDRGDHIDHCLASPNLVKSMIIHTRWQWLSLSDHLPLEIETV